MGRIKKKERKKERKTNMATIRKEERNKANGL